MRIFLASDLHTEFGNKPPRMPIHVDVIVLAGDIATSVKSIQVAQFYRDMCRVPVVLVAGNHEFYGGDFNKTLSALRAAAQPLQDIYFLEMDSVVIQGVRFLGATLWTTFSSSHYAPEYVMEQSQHYIADFTDIGHGRERLHPRDVAIYNALTGLWLEQELAKPFDGKTVVVSHFAPHHAAAHPAFKDAGPPHDEVNAYFLSDCSALMREYPIDAWLYGHTHHSVDVVVEGRTRLISNQRGYPGEPWEHTRFEPEKTFVI